MKTLIAPSMLALACLAGALTAITATPASAQFPIHHMGSNRLGVGYDLLASGQNITKQNVGSQQLAHSLSLAYAPAPYVGLVLGLGVARFETEPTPSTKAFEGTYAFSPSLGLRLATPGWVKETFRVTAGLQTQYLNSEDRNSLAYSAFVIQPELGLLVSPLSFVDIGLGGRLHLVNGEISAPRSAGPAHFANETVGRGYLSVTLKTPSEGAFFSIDLDLSPESDANWSHGPVESTLRLTMGTVLGWKSREPKASPRNPYFPNYRDLKDRQEQMSDELQAD